MSPHTATHLPPRVPSLDGHQTAPDVPGSTEDVIAAGVLLDLSRVISTLVGLAQPALGVRTELITSLVRLVVRHLDLDGPWEFEVAARLSQIGLLGVPDEQRNAALRGDPLSDDEWLELASHPLAARDLLAGVGRLDGVREMIARQREPFALRCEPTPPVEQRHRIVLGGQILRVCADYVSLLEADLGAEEALARLSSQPLECDPALVGILARCVADGGMPVLAA